MFVFYNLRWCVTKRVVDRIEMNTAAVKKSRCILRLGASGGRPFILSTWAGYHLPAGTNVFIVQWITGWKHLETCPALSAMRVILDRSGQSLIATSVNESLRSSRIYRTR